MSKEQAKKEIERIAKLDEALCVEMGHFLWDHGWSVEPTGHWQKTFHPEGEKSYKRRVLSPRVAFGIEVKNQLGE